MWFLLSYGMFVGVFTAPHHAYQYAHQQGLQCVRVQFQS